MTQGIAFPRSLRALQADSFRASKLWLLVAAALLGVWTWWMFTARIAQYETVNDVRIEGSRAIARITNTQAGAAAFVHVGDIVYQARVAKIVDNSAELIFTDHQPPTTNHQPPTADIEVARVSPASIAFRSLARNGQ